MREVLKQRPNRQTLIISSHNLHEIERICDHVAFMQDGRVVHQGRTDDVTGRSRTMQYRLMPGALPLPDSGLDGLHGRHHGAGAQGVARPPRVPAEVDEAEAAPDQRRGGHGQRGTRHRYQTPVPT